MPSWIMCWSWTRCGPLFSKKANKRWVWVALCRRTRQIVAFSLVTVVKRVVFNSGGAYRWPTNAVTRSVIFGMLTNVFSRQTVINRWAKTVVKRTISSAGSIPCGNAWLVLSAKPCRFPNLGRFHETVFRLFVHHYNQTCISQ